MLWAIRCLCSAITLLSSHALLAAGPEMAPASTAVATSTQEQPEDVSPTVPTPHPVSQAQGYNGYWWGWSRFRPMMRAQVSGGVAFEPMDHAPVALYAKAVDKTFFAYAGAPAEQKEAAEPAAARMMVGCYDHASGTFARPTVLLDNLPAGARGCPALSVDAEGRLWVFVAVLGADYPSSIYRTVQPHQIDKWEKVRDMDFQQPQVWRVPGRGFVLLHVLTVEGMPRVHFSTSTDGLSWSKPVSLANFGEGQSCISGLHNAKIGVAMTYREPGHPVESRSDLYYLETADFGQTWQAYPKQKLELPLASADNPARAFDHGNWRFFLRDLQFDPLGNPVILYAIRHERRVQPAAESRLWTTSRWTGREWETTAALFSDSDYDAGCMEVERLVWHVTKPGLPGPQPNSAGGEIVRWRSEDQGRSWYPQPLTLDSPRNNNWVRHIIDAQPGLSLLWADGHTRMPSESRLYFADQAGNVYALPEKIEGASAKPELIHKAPEPQTQPEQE